MAVSVNTFLLLLSDASSKQANFILQHYSKNQGLVRASNLLQGNIPVGTDQMAKLKRFKSFYRELARKGVSCCRLAKNSN